MTLIAEDPTILIAILTVVGGAFLAALKATQQGRHLVCAAIAFGLALAVFAIERAWVTDNERIEDVVYDLRDAVADSDADRVLSRLAPNVQYGRERGVVPPETARALIRSWLAASAFDFVRVSGLRTNVGKQSRRGTAEFRVAAKGTVESAAGAITVGAADSVWSLGFQEVEPRVWKVNRITPVSVPRGLLTTSRPAGPNRYSGAD